MTIGKKTALAVGVVGALGLGLWIGNEMVNRQLKDQAANTAPAAVAAPAAEPTPAAKPRTAHARRAATPATPEVIAERTEKADEAKLASVAVTSPDLHALLKPVLNRGANLTIAGEGFRDGEQFATIAHAARNTAVPFMLLKHRVLDEGKTLAAAISESKPDLDARIEAERARSQARDDLAAIASN